MTSPILFSSYGKEAEAVAFQALQFLRSEEAGLLEITKFLIIGPNSGLFSGDYERHAVFLSDLENRTEVRKVINAVYASITDIQAMSRARAAGIQLAADLSLHPPYLISLWDPTDGCPGLDSTESISPGFPGVELFFDSIDTAFDSSQGAGGRAASKSFSVLLSPRLRPDFDNDFEEADEFRYARALAKQLSSKENTNVWRAPLIPLDTRTLTGICVAAGESTRHAVAGIVVALAHFSAQPHSHFSGLDCHVVGSVHFGVPLSELLSSLRAQFAHSFLTDLSCRGKEEGPEARSEAISDWMNSSFLSRISEKLTEGMENTSHVAFPKNGSLDEQIMKFQSDGGERFVRVLCQGIPKRMEERREALSQNLELSLNEAIPDWLSQNIGFDAVRERLCELGGRASIFQANAFSDNVTSLTLNATDRLQEILSHDIPLDPLQVAHFEKVRTELLRFLPGANTAEMDEDVEDSEGGDTGETEDAERDEIGIQERSGLLSPDWLAQHNIPKRQQLLRFLDKALPNQASPKSTHEASRVKIPGWTRAIDVVSLPAGRAFFKCRPSALKAVLEDARQLEATLEDQQMSLSKLPSSPVNEAEEVALERTKKSISETEIGLREARKEQKVGLDNHREFQLILRAHDQRAAFESELQEGMEHEFSCWSALASSASNRIKNLGYQYNKEEDLEKERMTKLAIKKCLVFILPILLLAAGIYSLFPGTSAMVVGDSLLTTSGNHVMIDSSADILMIETAPEGRTVLEYKLLPGEWEVGELASLLNGEEVRGERIEEVSRGAFEQLKYFSADRNGGPIPAGNHLGIEDSRQGTESHLKVKTNFSGDASSSLGIAGMAASGGGTFSTGYWKWLIGAALLAAIYHIVTFYLASKEAAETLSALGVGVKKRVQQLSQWKDVINLRNEELYRRCVDFYSYREEIEVLSASKRVLERKEQEFVAFIGALAELTSKTKGEAVRSPLSKGRDFYSIFSWDQLTGTLIETESSMRHVDQTMQRFQKEWSPKRLWDNFQQHSGLSQWKQACHNQSAEAYQHVVNFSLGDFCEANPSLVPREGSNSIDDLRAYFSPLASVNNTLTDLTVWVTKNKGGRELNGLIENISQQSVAKEQTLGNATHDGTVRLFSISGEVEIGNVGFLKEPDSNVLR